jgi:hypothetical protein
MRSRHLVGIVGCETVDINGRALVPASRQGRPSETAQFIEVLATKESSDACATELLLVTDCYKICDSLEDIPRRTVVPGSTRPTDRFLAWAGLPFRPRYDTVDLVDTHNRITTVVTATGAIDVGTGQTLAAARAYWRERISVS